MGTVANYEALKTDIRLSLSGQERLATEFAVLMGRVSELTESLQGMNREDTNLQIQNVILKLGNMKDECRTLAAQTTDILARADPGLAAFRLIADAFGHQEKTVSLIDGLLVSFGN